MKSVPRTREGGAAILKIPHASQKLLRELETVLHRDIPMTRHLGLHVGEFNDKGLYFHAPLTPNINHEGTVFGGSLAAATTLVSWGLLWLVMKQHRSARIVVQESYLSYMRPVTKDFVAHCIHPSDAQVHRMLTALDRHKKGRIELFSEVQENGKPCVGYRGRFVVLPEDVK